MATDNYGTSGQGNREDQQNDGRTQSETNRNLASRESDRTNYQGSGREEDQRDLNLDSGASDRGLDSSRSGAGREWNSDDMSNNDYSASGSESEGRTEDTQAGWDSTTDRDADQRNDRGESL